MDKILSEYKEKLEDIIVDMKSEVKESFDINESLNKVRDELSKWGKNNLSLMFQELKGYVEKNNPKFIEENKEKWETMLDKADALTQYGLYVAPIDLLRSSDNTAKSIYVGAGAFVSSIVFTKLAMKKAKFLPSLLTSVISGVAAYYLLDANKDEEMKNMLLSYIDDAKDWIDTAFENMYRIFKDAAA